MSLHCSRGFFFIYFWVELPCTQDEFLHDATWRNFEHTILNMQLNNAMFIYFKMCSICKFFTIIVENIYIPFQSLVT